MYDDAEYHNFDHVPSPTEIDLRLIYYEWLADSGATSHITHRRDAFDTYQSISAVPIAGVGGAKAHAIGRGNIKLKSECDGHTYILELTNVLHVPKNKNNLLSLGKWEKQGRSYNGCDDTLTLLTKDKRPGSARSDYAFSAASPLQSWETWHRRFGHVGYSGIKKLNLGASPAQRRSSPRLHMVQRQNAKRNQGNLPTWICGASTTYHRSTETNTIFS